MALYAFDGTWNSDKPGAEHDTNVLWFVRGYNRSSFYRPGVGTRFGPFGQVVGGITGAGGHTRVHEGLQQLALNVAAGDAEIDVVGVQPRRGDCHRFRKSGESAGRPPDGSVLGH